MMNSHVVEVPNWQTSMTIGFQQLLQNGDLCDVTLEGNDGMDIRCHSIVLAAASPYFRSTLVWTREDFHIKIGSISSNTWKAIVEFMYCGRIIFDGQNAMEIVMITKKLGLTELHTSIQQYLRKFGVTEDYPPREPRSIESDSIRVSHASLHQDASPMITSPVNHGDSQADNSASLEQPELSPIITSAFPLGPNSAIEKAAPSAEVPDPTPLQLHQHGALISNNKDGNIIGQAAGITTGNADQQMSFFRGLGLTAQKAESEKSSPDSEVRQSKRNSGKKTNFRELDGRRQSGQGLNQAQVNLISHALGIDKNEKDVPMEAKAEGGPMDGEYLVEGADGKSFTCRFCFRSFPTRSLLCKHKGKWHAKTKTKGKKSHKTFWCKLCNISFRAPSALYKHKKDFHPEIINKSKVTAEDMNQEDQLLGIKVDTKLEPVTDPVTELSTAMPRQFTCKLCDEIYPDRHSLYQHKMDEHYVKKQNSRPKGMKYTPVPGKKAAAPKPRGAYFKCKKCFKAFTNPGSLRWHKCGTAGNPLPEGVTPIHPVAAAVAATNGNGPQLDPALTNGDAPLTGDERITPIQPKIEVTEKDTDDVPLDLSTKCPGTGMAYRCDDCQRVFSSLILVRWHRSRCTAGRQNGEELGLNKDASPALTCNLCQKVFKSQGFLHWHLSRRHGIKGTETTSSSKIVEEPLLQEPAGQKPPNQSPGKSPKAPVECRFCFKSFANKRILREHMHDVHDTVDHRCHICNKSFSRKYYLKHHIKKVHEGSYKPIHCEVCKKAFITKHRLVRHMKIFHNLKVAIEDLKQMDDVKEPPIKVKIDLKPKAKVSSVTPENYKNYPLTCDQCPRRFAQPHHLARHRKATHFAGGVIFSCEKCSQQFNNEKLLLAHLDREHMGEEDEDTSDQDMKMPGLIASTTSITTAQFEQGFQAAPQEAINEFICGICRSSFSTEIDLRGHVKVAHEQGGGGEEEGEEGELGEEEDGLLDDDDIPSPNKNEPRGNVACPHCSKKLTSRSILAQHIRTVHEGIRDYQCNICNKRFAQKHHLSRHVFLHGGVRPFECQLCNKRFITNYSLVQHSKMSHKDL